MQLITNEQHREFPLAQLEMSSRLLGLRATFGTRVHKFPEMTKKCLQSCPEVLNVKIRTRQTCKLVTSSKFYTVEFLNNGPVRTSGLSLFTHDLHVDVESVPKLLLDPHVIRSFVDNLDSVPRSRILITQLRNRPNSSFLFSCQTILEDVDHPNQVVLIVEINRHTERTVDLSSPCHPL